MNAEDHAMHYICEAFDDPFSYLEWMVAARATVLDYDISTHEEFTSTAHFISANLQMLLPEIPREQHLAFSREVKWHQIWAAHDQREFHLARTTRVIDSSGIFDDVKGGRRNAIFCTYHVGSYRLINIILHALDVPYSLVADHEFVTEQADEVRSLAWDLQSTYLKVEPKELEVLDAEQSSGAFKALRRLKEGRSLLFYIDGNTGVGGHTQDREKYIAVNFFGHELHARKGIAFISYSADIPIIPVICVRTGWLDRELHVLEPIVPDRSLSRDEFCRQATQQLYSTLEKYLRNTPEQWEGWMYIHKFINTELLFQHEQQMAEESDMPEFLPDILYTFNSERYVIMQLSEQDFLFDRRTFRIVPLTYHLKEVLNAFQEPASYADLCFDDFAVTEEAIRDLYHHNVIVAQPDGTGH